MIDWVNLFLKCVTDELISAKYFYGCRIDSTVDSSLSQTCNEQDNLFDKAIKKEEFIK